MAKPEAPQQFLGTTQFPDAGDLSSYLIHMTSSGEALASILASGHIEARNPFGLAGKRPENAETHKAACFTEAPASEIDRIRRGRFGIAFHRDLIIKAGGQRVWYLNYGTPAWDAFLHEVNRLHAIDDPSRFKELSPYIDMVRPQSYEFDWEREWRVLGGLRFEWEDIAYVIVPGDNLLTFETKPEIGNSFYNAHDMGYEWTGGILTELDDAMEELVSLFHHAFSSPESHLYYDPEDEDGYAWGHYTRWETWEAVEYLFEDRPAQVLIALEEHLDRTSLAWLLDEELNEPPEADEDEDDPRERLRQEFPPEDPNTPDWLKF